LNFSSCYFLKLSKTDISQNPEGFLRLHILAHRRSVLTQAIKESGIKKGARNAAV
jgi:hypothetical protein